MQFFIKAAFLLLLSGVSPALAQGPPLEAPKKAPILEIAGKIQVKNKERTAVFDRDMLEAMGLETIVTSTPWDNGKVRFEGVPMTKLLDRVKAEGKTIRAVALNDYVSLVPVEDFAKHGVILALKRDGQYMPVRDKGPLFIVYPFDSNPELQAQMYYARAVWQVKRIEVE
jgi:hypothetical protein